MKVNDKTPFKTDYSRKWLVMSATGMGIFLATVDGSIVNVALPTLVEKLQTDFSIIQWVVLGYLLTVTTLLLSFGRLGDIFGKKSLYAAGFIIFTIGSVLCGLSPSVYWLIAFRVIQGFGAALIMALGMAIVTEAFPPNERGKALGISGTIVSIGIAIGPAMGGLIISYFSWRWIFFVNLPIGITGTAMVFRFIQQSTPPGKKQKFDCPGALFIFISLLSLLLGLTFGQQKGFNQLSVFCFIAVWAVTLIIFIVIEIKSAHPMINPGFFKNRIFSINLINGFITFIGVAGTIILLPFYLQNILRYPTVLVGLLLCVVPVALGITSPISGILSDRFGTRLISTIGLVIVFFGFYSISTLTEFTSTTGYILRLLPLGLGMGIFQSPNNSAVMGSLPKEHLGVASGLLAMSRTLGQTVGVAVLGALWAGRTFYYTGSTLPGGATVAPVNARISALHDTFLITVGLLSICLILSIWKFTYSFSPPDRHISQK